MNEEAPPSLPFNIEAEQALLGTLLYDSEAVFSVDGAVRSAHFYEPFHQRLFDAVRDSALKGRATDPALLAQRFEDDPAWIELGGTSYLGLLIDRAPPSANAPDYARAVAGLSTRRELIRVGREITAGARSENDPEEAVAHAERLLGEVTAIAGATDQGTSASDLIADAITYARSRGGRVAYSFGLGAVDNLTGGLNAGEMTIVAGRPGAGKTVVAQTIARANAAAGLGTCFYSLEMSANPLGLRLACDLAFDRRAPSYSGRSSNPTSDKAIKNELSPDQWRALEQAKETVEQWPLHLDTRAGLTLTQIEANARRAHSRWAQRGIKPGPVIIDHLGKVRPSVDRRGNLYAETADLSAGAAEMAKRLGVPVVALVQLNRGVEQREEKRPALSDLRNAGNLEEDARQVLMIYRPEYYLREPLGQETFEQEAERRAKLEQARNKLFFLAEKNSHGPIGQVQAYCEIACSAIRDWEL
jgi:replicative DNA helicase